MKPNLQMCSGTALIHCFDTKSKIIKIRYIREIFGVDTLTDGKVYKAAKENGMYSVNSVSPSFSVKTSGK